MYRFELCSGINLKYILEVKVRVHVYNGIKLRVQKIMISFSFLILSSSNDDFDCSVLFTTFKTGGRVSSVDVAAFFSPLDLHFCSPLAPTNNKLINL